MATFTFGTLINPSHYIEIPDPVNVGQVKRPAAGVTLLVRNAATLASLTSRTTTAYGYIPVFTLTDVPQIQVSADNGNTWVGPLTAREAITSAITAGVDATNAVTQSGQALTTASQALTTAQTALNTANSAVAGSGGGTFTGTVDWRTQVTNRPLIPATATDVGAISLSARGTANGVASLDATALVPLGQLPVGTTSGTVAAGSHTHTTSYATLPAGSLLFVDYNTATNSWPVRPTSRTDVRVIWSYSVGSPPPAGNGYALPGDRFELLP